MCKAREKTPLNFDGASLLFFPDLAKETLDRRRALKPLTEKLRVASISYRWSFPVALIAHRDVRLLSSASLRTWRSSV